MEIVDFFFGNALGVVDGKSRASLPASFRAVAERRAQRGYVPGTPFPEKAMLMGPHPRFPCIQGFDQTYQSALFARLQAQAAASGADPFDALEDAQLEINGTFTEVGYDPSGRIVLPATLRQAAGIEPGGLAFFIAAGETFQIWSPDRFRAYYHDKPRLIAALDALLDERGRK